MESSLSDEEGKTEKYSLFVARCMHILHYKSFEELKISF
jgi:hypothetical protein